MIHDYNCIISYELLWRMHSSFVGVNHALYGLYHRRYFNRRCNTSIKKALWKIKYWSLQYTHEKEIINIQSLETYIRNGNVKTDWRFGSFKYMFPTFPGGFTCSDTYHYKVHQGEKTICIMNAMLINCLLWCWYYRKTSNISPTLVGNNIVDNSDVVGASPFGAAPTTSSFSA